MKIIDKLKDNLRSKDVAIDLGTSSVLVYVEDRGIVINEPSVVAVDTKTEKIIKVGCEAQAMVGRTAGNIKTVRPLRGGVVAQYEVTYRMLKYFLGHAGGDMFFNPRVMLCVPGNVSDVERRAVMDAAYEAGSKSVYMISEPLAAAIGAGLQINVPNGNLIVDIGGGMTDIAVISMGGTVAYESVRCGGDAMTESIIAYTEKKYTAKISERLAEQVKLKIGNAYPNGHVTSVMLVGNGITDGLPKDITLTSEEIPEAIRPCIDAIVDGIRKVIACTPAELIPDILTNGITMTGNGCLMPGIDSILAELTGIGVKRAENPGECTVRGAIKALAGIMYDSDDDNNPRLV